MNTPSKLRIIPTFLILALSLALTACPDTGSEDGETGTETGAETGVACDPEGANPEMGALLNAPVADDVEVIVKTPQHPGAPGPENLP